VKEKKNRIDVELIKQKQIFVPPHVAFNVDFIKHVNERILFYLHRFVIVSLTFDARLALALKENNRDQNDVDLGWQRLG